MRLTLRTMLAYLDQVLDQETSAEIAEKIRQSEVASEIIQRIEDVLRRPRLGAPELSGRGMQMDPNTVAEYLDNVLSKEQVADFEKSCLESNTLLAEVASCHRVLANILDQPVDVSPECRKKLYELFQHRKELRSPAPEAEAKPSGKSAPAATPAPEAHALEEELLAPPPARETNWRWLLAAALAVVLVVCTLMSVSPQGFWKGGQEQMAQDTSEPSPPSPVQPSQPSPSEPAPPKPPKPTPADQADADSSGQPKSPASRPQPPAPDPLPKATTPVPPLPESEKEEPSGDRKPMPNPSQSPSPPDAPPQPVQPLPAPKATVKPLPLPPKPASKPSAAVGKLTSPGALLYRPQGEESWDWVHERLAPLRGGDRLVVPYGFSASVMMADGVQLQFSSQTQFQLPPKWPAQEKPLQLARGRLVVLTPGQQVTRIPLRLGPLAGQVELLTPGAAMACQVRYQRPPGTDLLKTPSQVQATLFCIAGTLRWRSAQGEAVEVGQNGQIVLRGGQEVAVQAQASPPPWLHQDTLPQLIRDSAPEFLRLLHQELDPQEADKDKDKDVELVLREVAQQHPRVELSYLALVHLLELGIFDPAVDALREPRFRKGSYWEKLLNQLYQAASVSPEAAQRVQTAFLQRRGESVGQQLFLLLRGFSREELMQEAVANQVVALLGHGDLDFRRLTLWNLKRALEVRNTSYQPHAPNNRGMLEWRNRLQRLRKQAARLNRK